VTEPLDAIGLVEVSSIALGHVSEDAMLKAATVDLLLARTICSGKFIIVVGGDVAACQAAVEAGASQATGGLIEKRVIPHVHPSIFPAISMAVDLDPAQAESLGVIETFSASSIVDVATPRPRPPPSPSSASTSRWRSGERATSCSPATWPASRPPSLPAPPWPPKRGSWLPAPSLPPRAGSSSASSSDGHGLNVPWTSFRPSSVPAPPSRSDRVVPVLFGPLRVPRGCKLLS